MTDKKQTKKKPKRKKKKGIEEIKKLNILGTDFKIIWRPPKNPERDGEIFLDEGLIKVDPNLEESEKREVLVHEIFHFFVDYYHLEEAETLIHAMAKFHLDLNKKLKDIK